MKFCHWQDHGSQIFCFWSTIGGAKSGINFDPNDPEKKGVLQRWYKAVSPL
jgi:glutamate dehydrogenase/leucine dehydrogenase